MRGKEWSKVISWFSFSENGMAVLPFREGSLVWNDKFDMLIKIQMEMTGRQLERLTVNLISSGRIMGKSC